MLDENVIDNELGMSMSTEMRGYLTTIYKWASFLSILGFVFCGLLLIGSLFAGSSISSIYSQMDMPIPAFAIVLIYAIIGLIWFFPVLYLFKFSTSLKAALSSGSDSELTAAFKNLKSHYKYIGIFAIIIMGFYALILLFGLGSFLFLGM